jgi:hypothetical protein
MEFPIPADNRRFSGYVLRAGDSVGGVGAAGRGFNIIFLGLPTLWWEEPNMASILDAFFMVNSQRFDTANRVSLLLICFFCTPLGVHRSVERMPHHRFPHPVGVRPFFRLQRIKHIF